MSLLRRRLLGGDGPVEIEGALNIFPQGDASIWYTVSSSNTARATLQYSYDGVTFTAWPWTNNTTSQTLRIGPTSGHDAIYVRGIFKPSGTPYPHITGALVDIKGNIMDIIDYNNPVINMQEMAGTFSNYFQYCKTTLRTGPRLPAIILKKNAYKGMYKDCTALTTMPELPAQALYESSYDSMFQGCTSLVNTPEEIGLGDAGAYRCAQYMFQGCTSMTTAPSMPNLAVVGSQSMIYMYDGCNSLITGPEIGNSQTPLVVINIANSFQYMFRNCINMTTGPSILNLDMSNIIDSYTGLYLPDTAVCMNMFENCYSLLVAPELPALKLGNSAYKEMFLNCTSMTTPPPQLPATVAGKSTYYSMFEGCISLISAPTMAALSAPATGYFGQTYTKMFYGCSSLTTVQSVLPIHIVNSVSTSSSSTTRTGMCESMFEGCISLVTPPKLTNLEQVQGARNFYRMFYGCTSIVNASNMFPTQLPQPGSGNAFYLGGDASFGGNFESMFEGCTSLTTAPRLIKNAFGGYTYRRMFYGCTSLVNPGNIFPLPYFTGSSSSNYGSNITSWSSSDKGPFVSMFEGCTSLTTAPKISDVTSLATTISGADGYFYRMFYGCSSLRTIKFMPRINSSTVWARHCTDWVVGVPTTGTANFYRNSAISSYTRVNGTNAIPSATWTLRSEAANVGAW